MKKDTFVKEYKNLSAAKSVFNRYSFLYSACIKAKTFKLIYPIVLNANKIIFKHIDIKYSFAQKYRNGLTVFGDGYRLGSILAEFHALVNDQKKMFDSGILHGDFGGGNVVIDFSGYWWLIDCEKPIDGSGKEKGSYYEDIAKTLIFLRLSKSVLYLFKVDLAFENSYIIGYEAESGNKINFFTLEKYYLILALRSIKILILNKNYLVVCSRIIFLLFHIPFYFIYNNVLRRYRKGTI